MSAPNPQVSVFHFSSKVSKAKIQKYKLATERGMAPDLVAANQAKSAAKRSDNRLSNEKLTLADDAQSATTSPPRKKPRLKLNVRSQPSENPDDNIEVSGIKQTPPLKYRFSHDVYSKSHKDKQQKSAVLPTPSPPISIRSSTPAKESEPRSAREDYGDFMSYYIAEGDDEQGQADASDSKPSPKPKSPEKSLAPSALKPNSPRRPITKPILTNMSRTEEQTDTTVSMSQQREGMTYQPQPPTLPLTLPQPTFQIVEMPTRPKGSRPDTINEMIEKLTRLSRALMDFAGVPPSPPTPPEQDEPPEGASSSNNMVDHLLAQFEISFDDKDLDSPLEITGTPDPELRYGITFIQNALKSWAQQRMTNDVLQRWQAHQATLIQQMQQQMAQSQHLGKPHEHHQAVNPSIQFAPIPLDLANTPEGAALIAFQDVLDSGCLQVNCVVPKELARALRHLYRQIDHLINSSSNVQPPWKCMSYNAQIKAQRILVDNVKRAHAHAQEDPTKQQHAAQGHFVDPARSRGQSQQVAANITQNSSQNPVQHAHAVGLEGRRSSQHAAQQPYSSHQYQNPLQHGMPYDVSGSTGRMAYALPVQTSENEFGRDFHHPQENLSGFTSIDSQSGTNTGGTSPKQNRTRTKQVQLDKMKVYTPGYLPRSGKTMKFSFASPNERALQVFGAESFPVVPGASNLPTRGPMGISSLEGSNQQPAAVFQPRLTPQAETKTIKPSDRSIVKTPSQTIVKPANPTTKSLAPQTHAKPSKLPQNDSPSPQSDEDTIRVAIKPMRAATASTTSETGGS